MRDGTPKTRSRALSISESELYWCAVLAVGKERDVLANFLSKGSETLSVALSVALWRKTDMMRNKKKASSVQTDAGWFARWIAQR
mmetsp:Transcript_1546/g.4133  ORF Transcript_1546/g.4133 Transcript_1546/m.4133 type:complete len:85 (+) Transcript_1546:41-295(+)